MSNGSRSDMFRRQLAGSCVKHHPLYVSENRGVKVNGGSFPRPPGRVTRTGYPPDGERKDRTHGPPRVGALLICRSNSSRTRMFDRNCPHRKKFRKRGLTPPKGCATRGASLAVRPTNCLFSICSTSLNAHHRVAQPGDNSPRSRKK